jgi:dTDP-6-deoxy-L-talose 4-dehydrogenase (NAD+)
MKILVTGANGYLGQGIVKRILDKGIDVVATDFKTNYVDDRANKVDCDLFTVVNPFEFFAEPNVLLHLAWKDGFQHYSDSHIDDLQQHYHFIKRMLASGLKQVAIMGTMHEIGFFEGCVKEDTPCFPITPYGISKNALRQSSQQIVRQNGGIFQWLRGYYIVGNSQFGCSVFSKITAAVGEGKREFPFTLGQNQYDFIDYNVFCEQVAAVVCQEKVTGIIEICSGRPEKLSHRMERFILNNNYNIKLMYGEFPDRPYDSKAIWGDSSKIETIMNMMPGS